MRHVATREQRRQAGINVPTDDQGDIWFVGKPAVNDLVRKLATLLSARLADPLFERLDFPDGA